MQKSLTAELAWRYPQLVLEPSDNLVETEEYKNIVRRGILDDDIENPFQGDLSDKRMILKTPVGDKEVFHLANRSDFERFVQIVCWRSAKPVPASMGAVTAFGVINWRRIQKHKEEYLASGGTDWGEEFKKFTQKADNYKDNIVVVARGFYSGLNAVQAGFSDAEWEEISLKIRIYHELTHVISRTLFPDNKDVFRDEVLADCIGLISATGSYDHILAKKLLGIEGNSYRHGARLENYLSLEDAIQNIVPRAVLLVDTFADTCKKQSGKPAFDILDYIEINRIGLECETRPLRATRADA